MSRSETRREENIHKERVKGGNYEEKQIIWNNILRNEASDYAKEQGYLDYATFVKSFDAVMSNDIIQKTWEIIGYWEQAGIMF